MSDLAQDGFQWRVIVPRTMTLRVPQKTKDFLVRRASVIFSRISQVREMIQYYRTTFIATIVCSGKIAFPERASRC
jgi:hypothetical protein